MTVCIYVCNERGAFTYFFFLFLFDYISVDPSKGRSVRAKVEVILAVLYNLDKCKHKPLYYFQLLDKKVYDYKY